MSIKSKKNEYDLAVIGGGPAGMIAAGRAAEAGARVILLEKNHDLGVKLLATGGGRCNFSNKQENNRVFIEKFGQSGKFLFSAYSRFGSDDALNFFEEKGVPAKIEDGGRVFPKSDRAKDILDALFAYLRAGNVEIKTGARIVSVVKRGRKVSGLKLKNGDIVKASNYIIAVGGCSYPQTGSDGDGYAWARSLGHQVLPPVPALTPLILKDIFVKDLEGLSLSGVAIKFSASGKKIFSFPGDIVFTADGISGPAVLDASRLIGREKKANISLFLDIFPNKEFEDLDRFIADILQREAKKSIKNALSGLLPERFLGVFLPIAGIAEDKRSSFISRQERRCLVEKLKVFSLNFQALADFEKAYLSLGGVSLGEVDPKTMKSRLIDNLYFAGEILDLDGPTGGYNLQACWSTGYAAGLAAADCS